MTRTGKMTIRDLIVRMSENKLILPAIQRKYVWTTDQIELLFDSIMRGYPINTIMLWKVTDPEIKDNYPFYRFLTNYQQRYHEDNDKIDVYTVDDFEAVIDGQQRLTSLYLGLSSSGSYRYKMPRKWWRLDEDAMPTRRLYLNLLCINDVAESTEKMYDFEFLSDKDLEKSPETEKWFRVSDIMRMDYKKMNTYVKESIPWKKRSIARKILNLLYRRIHTDRAITYFEETDQNYGKVLDVFLRTNSGGTPLTFSDLLMAMSSTTWQDMDVRTEMDSVIREIAISPGESTFSISRDFLWKTLLVVNGGDVAFKIQNFNKDKTKEYQKIWPEVKNAVLSAFKLFGNLGFDDNTFRAKNAAIPVIYYIYKTKMSESIINSRDNLKVIQKWLVMSFISGIFGGRSDYILRMMRGIIQNTKEKLFPAEELYYQFRKEYYIDDLVLDDLLKSQYKSVDCTYLLMLLYPEVVQTCGINHHQDHMHPQSFFKNKKNVRAEIRESDWDFAFDEQNWNSVLNLQLLPGRDNSAKQDVALKKWVNENMADYSPNEVLSKLYVEDSFGLDILDVRNFRLFIDSRRIVLKKKLMGIVGFNKDNFDELDGGSSD